MGVGAREDSGVGLLGARVESVASVAQLLGRHSSIGYIGVGEGGEGEEAQPTLIHCNGVDERAL